MSSHRAALQALLDEGREILVSCEEIQRLDNIGGGEFPVEERRATADRLSKRYHSWYARTISLLPAQDEREFKRHYEGGMFGGLLPTIKTFFGSPLALNPLFKPGEPNPLLPSPWTCPYDAGLKTPMTQQLTLIERHMYAEAGVMKLPDRTLVLPKNLIGYQQGMEKFLSKNPYDKNVFVMMKYRDHNDHVATIISTGVKAAGKNPVLARDARITDELATNVMATLICCKYGIALFDEPEEAQHINPNVAYELGIMHFLDRKCLLLKSKNLPSLQSDILSKLYVPYDPARPGDIITVVQRWIENVSEFVEIPTVD